VTEPISDSLVGPLLERAAVGIAITDSEGRFRYVNARLAEINGVSAAGHIGRHFREVIPHLADAVAQLHAQVLATGEPVPDVQINGSTPGAPDRSWQVSYLPMELDGEPAVGVVLVDVTERERAFAAIERRVNQNAAVAELGHQALAGAAVNDLLERACGVVRQRLEADQAGVLQFVPDRSELVMCAGSGFPEGAVGRITAATGRGSQAGYTLLHGGPVLTHDLADESRFAVSAGMRAQGAVSTISTPIAGGPEPFGVLGVFSREPHHFNEDDAGFVEAVANVVGAAVARAKQAQALAELSGQRGRLVAQALEAGEREQRQVSDVLHDDVLQHLLFARQELSAAAGDERALERAQRSLDDATKLLRSVVAGLHPVTLAHAGLTAALEGLAGEHRARLGLRTDVQVAPAAEGLHDRLLVSVARELLTNVAKHAGADRALVHITLEDGTLSLRVADNGRGMRGDPFRTALANGNIGLATVRERAEALGGMTRVCEGLEGRGIGIEVRLPT
jgi:PAS domain S-box-containing protein